MCIMLAWVWCVGCVGICHEWTQVQVRGQLCRTKLGGSAGIIDTCCCFQLYMGSGESNTCVTSTLPTKPFPNPPKWKFWSSFYYIISLIMKCPFYSADMYWVLLGPSHGNINVQTINPEQYFYCLGTSGSVWKRWHLCLNTGLRRQVW